MIVFIYISTIVQNVLGYQNPHTLLLSEAMTIKRANKSQFLELFRPKAEECVSLAGYSVLITETVSENRAYNSVAKMFVKAAFDLKDVQFKKGKQYGVIGRDPYEASPDDLMAWKPSQALQAPSKLLTSYDFLDVEDNQMMVIYLLYSQEKSIFDVTVWPSNTRWGRNLLLKDNILKYVLDSTVDSMIIGGLGSPRMCSGVKDIFQEMFKDQTCAKPIAPINPLCDSVESIITPSTTNMPISVNKCGAQDLPFLFHSMKHGLESVNAPNDCSGAKFSLKEDPISDIMKVCGIGPSPTTAEKDDIGKQIVGALKTVNQVCPPNDVMESDYAEVEIRVHVDEEIKKQRLAQEIEVSSQKPHSFVKPEDIENMKKYQSNLVPVQRIENNEFKWLSYIFNPENPAESRFRCEICYSNKDRLHLSSQYMSKFASEKGQLKGTNLILY